MATDKRRPAAIALKTQMTTTVRRDCELILTSDHIRALLSKSGIHIPDGVTVQFTVPRGGDYSGMTLDIDEENPLTIRWYTQTTEDA